MIHFNAKKEHAAAPQSRKSAVRILTAAAAFVTVCVLMFLTAQPGAAVFAGSTDKAAGPVDLSRKGSLTLTYKSEDHAWEGLEIAIYRVASIGKDYQYTPVGGFQDDPIELNGLKSQAEWKTVAGTVGAYITADHISETAKSVTDAAGKVSFEELELGLYYVCWTGNAVAGDLSGFDSFVISVPTLAEEGEWIYDLDVFPKYGGNEEEPTEDYRKVVKQWKDYKAEKRPASVQIEIFCDGVLFAPVTLSSENNWTYTWKTEGTHEWSVVERDVPKSYTVTVEPDGATFVVTNTTTEKPPKPPQTGDSLQIVLWVVLAAVSGIGLIVLGLAGRRRRDA